MEKDKRTISQRLDDIERRVILGGKNVLTVSEAAEFLGVADYTVRKLARGNELAYSKPNGKTMYFRKEDLERWMMRNRVASNEEIDSMAATRVFLNPRKKALKA